MNWTNERYHQEFFEQLGSISERPFDSQKGAASKASFCQLLNAPFSLGYHCRF